MLCVLTANYLGSLWSIYFVIPPIWCEIASQLLFGQDRPDHLDRYRAFFEDRVVKIAVGHLFRAHQIAMKLIELKPAHHVRHLVKRAVIA